MTKRDVVRMILEGKRPPYVPWNFTFTKEAAEKLAAHYGTPDLDTVVDNHFLALGCAFNFMEPIGNGRVRDVWDVVWNRSVDKDIGIVEGLILPEPTLKNFTPPHPLDPRFFDPIPDAIARRPDCLRVFNLDFSFFERAWTLRGMENLMMDFLENPDFVHELLAVIADYNIAQICAAARYDIDAVYFGDDWGQQHGLIMGKQYWREFIRPQLERMYGAVHASGKFVMIHSCGDVDELFDDLVEIGVNCFNPFQPEVLDVFDLLPRYRKKMSFHGGLSTQKTLPFGTVADVRAATRRLLNLGAEGGFILSPAHAVEGDVSLENMLAFIEEAKAQPGYQKKA
ncbi:MAG: uroporphyrinogen-III decarboxylase-like protein [Candidatus Sumerlaeota bacterium]|nr:uroporphyrinogen-III decarboxylase-like protein [Candidatus Sumerlaeota bacterium]